jgi:hypothetical protein
VCRYSAAGGRWIEESVTFAYYCPEHQKPYDHTEYDRTVKSVRYFRTVPAIPARLEEVFPGDHPEEK